MIVAPFKVVLDANVLFPFSLRDTLLRAAAEGLFQLYWSEEILDETLRNLLSTNRMNALQAGRLRAAMTDAFPEAMVDGYQPLVAAMTNHEKDRHVAAVAVKAGAQVIVTSNLKDFATLPHGIEAQSPDEFLCNLFDLQPDGMVDLIREQAQALKNPPRSFEDLVRGLAKSVPEFADSIARHTTLGHVFLQSAQLNPTQAARGSCTHGPTTPTNSLFCRKEILSTIREPTLSELRGHDERRESRVRF
ncbi:MAG: PIN domain-containing protein [Polyangiaceae bacterium]|nr:PIN domain-containing protein [Polyangiaceae bacterium]MCB9610064.1 PIN domain-containing protein [Polyangiaceae bacterium]